MRIRTGRAPERDSGARLLSAYLCAMEVSTRVGDRRARAAFTRRVFIRPDLAGAFGCTLAAARLFGLDEAHATHAQGIVLSMASGSLEFLEDGAWTKRLHPGWAAVSRHHGGVAGKHGFVGPGAPYEGRYGLYALHLNDGATPDLCDRDSGTRRAMGNR